MNGSDFAKNTSRFEKPETLPLVELHMDVKLRRKLINLGYTTLEEAFNSDDSLIIDGLSDAAGCEYQRLSDLFENDYEKFCAALMTNPEANTRYSNIVMSAGNLKQHEDSQQRSAVKPAVSSKKKAEHKVNFAPPLPSEYSERMMALQTKAKKELGLLQDHASSALVFEAFSAFSLEMDELNNLVTLHFSVHKSKLRTALDQVEYYFPDAFLVYLVDAARRLFDKQVLWGYIEDELSIPRGTQSAEQRIKAIAMGRLNNYGFPVFRERETEFKYLYTMLLHAGLPEWAWTDLWNSVFLKAAKDSHSSGRSSSLPRGLDLFRMARSTSSEYAVKSVQLRRILDNAPEQMIVPIFDAAITVACEISYKDYSPDQTKVLSNEGLTNAAMRALRTIRESRNQAGQRNGKRRNDFIYLPKPELRINPDDMQRPIAIYWDQQQMPSELDSAVFQISLNGSVVHSEEVKRDIDRFFLPRIKIAIQPQENYDIEVKIMIQDDEHGVLLGSLPFTFSHSKPKVFEFIEAQDGIFRLRRPRTLISRTHKMIMFTDFGYLFLPGEGLSLESKYSGTEGWCGIEMYKLQVSPGAFGSIIDCSGNQVAAWQEDYAVTINKPCLLGKNAHGDDLFGCEIISDKDFNSQLPTITIDALNPEAALEDIVVESTCDNKTVSVMHGIIYNNSYYGEAPVAERLDISLAKSAVPHLVSNGRISVSSKSTGRNIVNYRFSVIPMKKLRPIRVYLHNAELWATYRLETLWDCVLKVNGECKRIDTNSYYDFDCSLAEADIEARVQLNGEIEMSIRLLLAGLEIELDGLPTSGSELPIIYYQNAVQKPNSISITIRSFYKRIDRGVLVMLGKTPVLFPKVDKEGYFLTKPLETACTIHDGMSHKLWIGIDYSAGSALKDDNEPCSIEIIDYQADFGLGDIHSVRKNDGLYARFQQSCNVPLDIRFVNKRRYNTDQIGDYLTLPPKETDILIPPKVARKIEAQTGDIILQAALQPKFSKFRKTDPTFDNAENFPLSLKEQS